MKFYSPYQFINLRPTTAKIQFKAASKKEREIESKYVRHDYWAKDGLSGSIQCTLTTQTPLVVGNKQDPGTEEKAGFVHQYTQPDGKVAIPANSLRGMIGSLAENISQSSLRVLSQKSKSIYSVRQTAQAGKKVGLLLKDATNGDFKLHKLKDSNGNDSTAWMLKRSDVAKYACKTYQHKKEDIHKFYYAQKDQQGYLTKVINFSEEPCNNLEKGIVYIRGDVFDRKTHESFIPWNGEVSEKGVEVNEQVHRFQTALQLNVDKKNPKKSLPVNYKLEKIDKDEYIPVVRDGDLVFYTENKNGIADLSYSQIWRKPVEGNLYEAIENSFGKENGKDLLPWNKGRENLSPAEAIFGVVEEDFDPKKGARNLSSRIQFTDAVPDNELSLDEVNEVTLKILASPKPPSPAMYFQTNDNSISKAISKDELNLDQHKHKPNGRKHYLPHNLDRKKLDENRENWETKYTDDNPPTKEGSDEPKWSQYLKCKPIPKDTSFTFTLHFENLSQEELGLLLISLQPDEGKDAFVHKLGLGKPLGLGQIKLKIDKLETTHRSENYTVDCLNAAEIKNNEFTSEEQQELITTAKEKGYIETDTLAELNILYNPENNKEHPVCYPYSSYHKQKAGEEGEGFKWFVANDALLKQEGIKHEFLKPIELNQAIQPLDSFSDQCIHIAGLKKIPSAKNWKPMTALIQAYSKGNRIVNQYYDYKKLDSGAWLLKDKETVSKIMENKEKRDIALKHPNGNTYTVTLTTEF